MKFKKMALFSILMTPLFLHASTVDLRIIETTDLHGNMMNYDYYQDKTTEAYGLVKTAELIKQARSEVKNSVLVDNGDLIQGSPMADYALKKGLSEDQIHPVYKVMNQLNYDVANIGNHEFNFGLDYLKQALSGARFPYVNANVYDAATGDHYFTPYLIQSKEVVDREGKTQQVKIGYIGFVPPQIMQWDKLNLNGKVYVADITKTAENLIPKMKNEGADVIVVIAHSGVSSEPYKALAENSVYYLTQVKDVNAVMFGHSHGLFPSSEFINLPKSDIEKGTINGVPSVMPGQWGSHLGVVDLILEGETGQWQVKQGTSEIRAIYDTQTKQALVGVDHQLIETLQLDHEGTREFVNQPIGKSEVEINSYLALFQDSPATRLINEAQTDYVKNAIQGDPDLDGISVLSAIAPFKAGGRKNDPSAYVEVAKGELTFRNAADIYLFPNLLTAVKIKGSDLKEWLECSAGMFNQIDVQKSEPQYLLNWEEFRTYNFDVISGLQYKIDVTQPPKYDGNCQLIHPESERVKDLTFEGKPIDLEQDFIIATNNYRAYSGIFPGTGEEKVLFNSPDDMRIILSNYIIKQTEEKGSIDVTLENDWRLSPIQSDIKLDIRVETSPSLNAKSYIEKEAYYPMHYLQNDSVGFAIYQLDLQSNSSLNK